MVKKITPSVRFFQRSTALKLVGLFGRESVCLVCALGKKTPNEHFEGKNQTKMKLGRARARHNECKN